MTGITTGRIFVDTPHTIAAELPIVAEKMRVAFIEFSKFPTAERCDMLVEKLNILQEGLKDLRDALERVRLQ